MIKKFIGAAYLLATSNLVFATGISTMIGNASLSNMKTNWDPEFVEGNTVVVGKNGIRLTTDASTKIGAIRLDNTLSYIGNYASSVAAPTIGSIAGIAKLQKLQTAGPGTGQVWTLTGTAGNIMD